METPQKIAEKAHALFIRYGIRSISMDDIAADLGISKKTIYQFYSNKDSLVSTLVDKTIGKHALRCTVLTANSDDAIIELYFLLTYAKELYEVLNTAIVRDLERNHESSYSKLKDHKELFLYPAIKASIERGIKAGLFRNDFDVGLIAKFFFESLALFSDPQIFPATHSFKTEQADELFSYLIRGITTPTGDQVINAYKNQKGIIQLTYEDGPFWDH